MRMTSVEDAVRMQRTVVAVVSSVITNTTAIRLFVTLATSWYLTTFMILSSIGLGTSTSMIYFLMGVIIQTLIIIDITIIVITDTVETSNAIVNSISIGGAKSGSSIHIRVR